MRSPQNSTMTVESRRNVVHHLQRINRPNAVDAVRRRRQGRCPAVGRFDGMRRSHGLPIRAPIHMRSARPRRAGVSSSRCSASVAPPRGASIFCCRIRPRIRLVCRQRLQVLEYLASVCPCPLSAATRRSISAQFDPRQLGLRLGAARRSAGANNPTHVAARRRGSRPVRDALRSIRKQRRWSIRRQRNHGASSPVADHALYRAACCHCLAPAPAAPPPRRRPARPDGPSPAAPAPAPPAPPARRTGRCSPCGPAG